MRIRHNIPRRGFLGRRRELLDYFENRNCKVCGRFYASRVPENEDPHLCIGCRRERSQPRIRRKRMSCPNHCQGCNYHAVEKVFNSPPFKRTLNCTRDRCGYYLGDLCEDVVKKCPFSPEGKKNEKIKILKELKEKVADLEKKIKEDEKDWTDALYESFGSNLGLGDVIKWESGESKIIIRPRFIGTGVHRVIIIACVSLKGLRLSTRDSEITEHQTPPTYQEMKDQITKVKDEFRCLLYKENSND